MIAIEPVLPWILPPLLGAMIGYLTNSIAIRMLFRPLREWRVLGVRVPFTPGVIPRRRHELAESIGDMVSRELLTPEVFTRRFEAPRFGAALRRSIGRSLEDLASRPVRDLIANPRIERALTLAHDGLQSLLCSDPQLLERLRRIAVETATVDATAEEERAARPLLLTVVLEIPIGVFEPVWGSPLFDDLIAGALSRLEQPLLDYFARPEVIAETNRRIRRLLHFAFDQLNTVQRIFVSAGQFDRQMESRIPELRRRFVAELRTLLTEPKISSSLAAGIRDSLVPRRGRPLSTLMGGEDSVRVLSAETGAIVDALARHLITSERCDDLVGRLYAALRHTLDSDSTLGTLLPGIRNRRGAIAYCGSRSVRDVLLQRIGTLITALDIKHVVVDRVDSLDVERVEALMLGIIKRHLRSINVFGALIGALIGGAQIGLSLLGIG